MTGGWRDESASEFSPTLMRLQETAPAPLGRAVLYALLGLLAATLAWAVFAPLDIVAVAEGKLVPSGYLKIIQPSEQGVVREVLVREGDQVSEGQVLARMDTALIAADGRALAADYQSKRLAVRRAEAQLAGNALAREPDDLDAAFAQAEAQRLANVRAHDNALEHERNIGNRARHDLAAAEQVRSKLTEVLPYYRDQEIAFEKLVRDGFAGRLMANEKRRERLEKEHDLRTQESSIAAARAMLAQSNARLLQLQGDYRRQLQQ